MPRGATKKSPSEADEARVLAKAAAVELPTIEPPNVEAALSNGDRTAFPYETIVFDHTVRRGLSKLEFFTAISLHALLMRARVAGDSPHETEFGDGAVKLASAALDSIEQDRLRRGRPA